MSKKGKIHSFETFGTVDGPGIRFVVFMQGCLLRCVYCHNRDTWDINGGEEYSSDDVINEMKKYLSYIRFSGGGITITGGEPTLQAEFVTEVFKKCREMGIHTALDTNGLVEIEKIEELLKYTDLILLDIKQIVDEKHKDITGVGNEKVKRFAFFAMEKGIPVWIRYVLVPGFTDNEEDLKLTAQFIKQLSNVEKIEVLPYHSMGAFKWEGMGQKYQLEGVVSPSDEQIKRAEKIIGASNF